MKTHTRIVTPTHRHLDDPMTILGFAISQWIAAGFGMLILWAVINYGQRFLSLTTTFQVGFILGGIPVLLATVAHLEGVSVLIFIRRFVRFLGPKEHMPGRPEKGPLSFRLVEHPVEDDDPDEY